MDSKSGITAVSFSRLMEFERCPYRSYLKIVAKEEQPPLDDNHPMIRGREIHEQVEHYIAGRTEEFPDSGKKLRPVLDLCREQFAEGLATVEDQWGFDREWNDVGWFDAGVWLRMATDCFVLHDPTTATIWDWKTGKSFGNEVKYMQQMQLYAVGAFMRHPELELAEIRIGFLDDGKQRHRQFERGDKINSLCVSFTTRFNRITDCVDFKPKPNKGNCKYCPFGPTTGTGVCIYGVES